MPSCRNPERCYLHNCRACLKRSAPPGVFNNNYILSPGAVGATLANPSDTVWFLSALIPTGRWERLPDCSRTRCVMCPQLIDWVILCSPYLTSRQRFVRTLEETFSCTKTDERWHHGLGMLAPLCAILSRLCWSTPVWTVFGGATCVRSKYNLLIFFLNLFSF